YLVMHKKDRNNYLLPSIPEINVADITEIGIDKDGKNIILSKKDGAWVVTDKNYPVEQESITPMLDIIKKLQLSALVSESGNLTPYELDSKNRIDVTVKSKIETLRKFEIGKTAPSFRHTFVRLDGDSKVYHAAKSFRRDFDKTVADLRDKKVLVFDKNKINSITLKKGDIVKDIAIKDDKPAVDDKKVDTNGEKSSDKTDEKPLDTIAQKSLDNSNDKSLEKSNDKPLENKEAIDSLLNMLASFKCHSFTDTDSKDEFKGMEEIASIILKGDKEFSIVIYKKDDKGNYPTLSSEIVYPFVMDTYQGDDLISKLGDALGIKKEDDKKENEMTKTDEADKKICRL
ncbi:MAG: DUF4340 domain-containing protein, partial [Desulfamplus sp.]|nr:DUF4340 domain-containing protein [Desulfamplus sp.]